MKHAPQLVRKFQAGDREAFAELIRRYQNYVASIAYSATGDFAGSEDITQPTFLTAWQRQTELKDPRRWSGWLRGIVRNLLRNSWRREQVERRHRERLKQTASQVEATSPLDHCLDQERTEMVWSVLEQIPETYREPLVLFYREGQSIEAVAELMDLSVDAVKQRLSRGRKRVRAEIEAMVEETLFDTRPSSRLTATVMAAIPATGGQAMGKAAQTAIGSIFASKWLAIALGPLIGIAGGVVGSKMALDSAESPRERASIWGLIVATTLWVVALLAVQLTVAYGFPEWYARPAFHVALWSIYLVILLWMIAQGNRQLATIRAEERKKAGEPVDSMAQAKPVSTLALRLNIVAALIGINVAPVLMAGLAHDWIALGAFLAVATSMCAVAWWLAPAYCTFSGQVRYNAWFCLAACTALAASVGFRWDAWQAALRHPFQPDWPGWIWAVGIFCFGLGLFVMLIRQAHRIENRKLSDEPPASSTDS